MIEKKQKNTRSRKYLLTINNPESHGLSHQTIISKINESKIAIRYVALCDEVGENGTYHSHVFLYFRNAIAFDSIKHMFPAANIQTALGTAEQCRSYLRKDHKEHNKNADGFYEYKDASGTVHKGQNLIDFFEEFGELPKDHQGFRSDLEQLYDYVKEGYTNAEIVDLMPKIAIRYLDKINRLRHDYLEDKYKGTRRLDLKVNYIFGATGTGKSRDILDEHGDSVVYRVTDYEHPFDSYKQEAVIVFEEFRSSLRLSDALNYMDIYPIDLPARYAPKVACFTTIYVVSNWPFENQYSELQKDPEQQSSYNAWVRRFNGVVKEYTGSGTVITYPTMQDYLQRFRKLPEGAKTPFDEPEEPKQEKLHLDEQQEKLNLNEPEMPFDD